MESIIATSPFPARSSFPVNLLILPRVPYEPNSSRTIARAGWPCVDLEDSTAAGQV